MKVLGVNDLIKNVETLNGQYVYVQGVLHPEFEGTCIIHYPKSETTEDYYKSSVYISAAMNFKFEEMTLKKWAGKRIIAGGTAYGPSDGFDGCGHMSLWAGEIVLTQIDLYSKHFDNYAKT
jgi:hypothetical protein